MSEPTGPESPARRSAEPGADKTRPGRLRRRGRAPQDDGVAPVVPNPGQLVGDEVAGTSDRGNPVAWTSLLLAVVLTVFHAVYALDAQGAAVRGEDVYTSIWLFVTLVLGLAAALLGIVGIAQRRRPRWPALAGLAVGLNGFLVAVFAWIGALMNPGV